MLPFPVCGSLISSPSLLEVLTGARSLYCLHKGWIRMRVEWESYSTSSYGESLHWLLGLYVEWGVGVLTPLPLMITYDWKVWFQLLVCWAYIAGTWSIMHLWPGSRFGRYGMCCKGCLRHVTWPHPGLLWLICTYADGVLYLVHGLVLGLLYLPSSGMYPCEMSGFAAYTNFLNYFPPVHEHVSHLHCIIKLFFATIIVIVPIKQVHILSSFFPNFLPSNWLSWNWLIPM